MDDMIEIPIDSTGDGNIDHIGYDTTGDGNIDFVGELDETGSEVVRLIPIAEYLGSREEQEDTTTGLAATELAVKSTRKKKLDEIHDNRENKDEDKSRDVTEIAIDSTGNGTIDAVGYDTTGDGYIDYVGVLNASGSEVERLIPIAEYLESHEGMDIRIDQQDRDIFTATRRISHLSDDEDSTSGEVPPLCFKCKHRHHANETCPVCGHTWPRGPKKLRRLSEGGYECHPVRACVDVTKHSQSSPFEYAEHDASSHVEEAQLRHSILRRHSGDWTHDALVSVSSSDSSAKGWKETTTRAARARASTYQTPISPSLHVTSLDLPQGKLGHDDEHSCDATSIPGKIARVSRGFEKLQRADKYVPPPSTKVSAALARLRSESIRTGERVPQVSEPRQCAIRERDRPFVFATRSSQMEVHAPHEREPVLNIRRGSFVSVGSVASQSIRKYSRVSPYVPPPSKNVHEPQRRLSHDHVPVEDETIVSKVSRNGEKATRRSVARQHEVAKIGEVVRIHSGHKKILPDRRESFASVPSPSALSSVSRESMSQIAPYLRHRPATPQPARHHDGRLRYQWEPNMSYSYAFHAILKRGRKRRKDRARLPPVVSIRRGAFDS